MPKNFIVIVLVILGVGFILYLMIRSVFLKAPLAIANPSPTPNRNITVTNVLNNPEVYSDLNLNLEGRIVNWITKNSFTISYKPGNFMGSPELLIITHDNFNLPDYTPADQLALGEIADVKVSGIIKIFDHKELKQEWGDILPFDKLATYDNRPVMFADSVTKK